MEKNQDDTIDHLNHYDSNKLIDNLDNPDNLDQLLADAQEYPTNTVIKKYLLMGGPIGGLLLLPFFIIMEIIEDGGVKLSLILNIVPTIISLAVAGLILGFPPSLITGVTVGTAQLHFGSVKQGITIFIIGFVSTIVSIFVFNSERGVNVLDEMVLAIGAVGGLSAIICGILFVPKSK
jgi:hypothetical protein